MKTVTIEIKNDIALRFLLNLESMHLIRLVESKPTSKKQKLSRALRWLHNQREG